MNKFLMFTVEPLLNLPRQVKRSIAILVDIFSCATAAWLAFYLRLDFFVSFENPTYRLDLAFLVSVVVALPVFMVFGMYKEIFRYSGLPTVLQAGRAMSAYTVIYLTICTVVSLDGVPRTVGFIQPLILYFLVASSRLCVWMILGDGYRKRINNKLLAKALIYGAGSAGRQLSRALRYATDVRLIGFVDDSEDLQSLRVNGFHVWAPEDLDMLITKHQITHIFLAMPSVPRSRKNTIITAVGRHGLTVQTVPSASELADGRISVSDMQDVKIDDLLGRDAVPSSMMKATKKLKGKVILITGAGGSIGGEICRQLVELKPRTLVLIEANEFALYNIEEELRTACCTYDVNLIPLICSIQDYSRLKKIMHTFEPHIVFHAAAYKHVPVIEGNIIEGIKNNVLGTLNAAKASIASQVGEFIFVSTDKAVRPTNVMGATKRFAEMIIQGLNEANIESRTKLSMVRFGNVLASSGSVIPKFRKQIENGGPITLTHPDVTRYFMTTSEAAQLVIHASTMAQGGEVFILHMGEPVKILNLAKTMIRLSGRSEKTDEFRDGDIEIKITGLRPGEKLYEELLVGAEPEPTDHPKIFKASENSVSWDDLESKITVLEVAIASEDADLALDVLRQVVADFQPFHKINDWMFLHRRLSENGS